ncbi:beta-ribofuranosylaminobenzene 5'-phosphate synthase family protein [Desulfosporosinus metallidurans]|uniref:Beta-ribofuranosylaminobenzene 5'-phosphate synthase n=1 Tax=Desulfosporosinus metallidurans TaxID=1888891 RepID=A0A1Q8QLY1_9FIRM|nr:beta-ribofuranosylaminobenzene 5'-phosphate synthase family protein [Desulfosporosinus metallidurans]OLN28343.1 beta-ribofuranosylaminobenzene 5'-phosphate synthase [Desulfosporosinus metallidurans]
MPKFWVKTGSRLHLGQLDLNGSLGRLYGGLGLAIDQPQLELTADRENGLFIDSPESEKNRVMRIAQQYIEHYSLPGAKINILQSLPSHSGLGSGTQLALALGFALTRVYGLQPSLLELAGLTDREGSRSGIGVAGFEQGGFLVDGGKPATTREEMNLAETKFHVPPLLTRLPFPEEWSVILAIPNKEEKMFGTKEEKLFKAMSPMEEHISGRISRLLLLKLLPSLIERDLKHFGQAVTEIQEYLGDYFTPVQGGRFATAQGALVADYMLSQGAAGVGQSSWGPTVYGFTDQKNLGSLVEGTRNFMGNHGQVWLAQAVNRGADWGWR